MTKATQRFASLSRLIIPVKTDAAHQAATDIASTASCAPIAQGTVWRNRFTIQATIQNHQVKIEKRRCHPWQQGD